MNRAELPQQLRWVAYLFLFNGISAMISMPVSFLQNRPTIDFSILGIFACFGLLRLSRGWRFYALFCTWFALVYLPVFGCLALTAPHANFNVLGFVGPEIPPVCATLMSFFWFLVTLWQLKILTRPDITLLFVQADAISRF